MCGFLRRCRRTIRRLPSSSAKLHLSCSSVRLPRSSNNTKLLRSNSSGRQLRNSSIRGPRSSSAKLRHSSISLRSNRSVRLPHSSSVRLFRSNNVRPQHRAKLHSGKLLHNSSAKQHHNGKLLRSGRSLHSNSVRLQHRAKLHHNAKQHRNSNIKHRSARRSIPRSSFPSPASAEVRMPEQRVRNYCAVSTRIATRFRTERAGILSPAATNCSGPVFSSGLPPRESATITTASRKPGFTSATE